MHLPIRSDHHSALDFWVALDNLLDSNGIQLFTIAEHDDIICSTVVDPVIREGRVLLIQIASIILRLLWKGVKEALQAWFLCLADNDLFVDTLFIGLVPVGTKYLRVYDEVLPQLRVRLVVVRPWRKSCVISLTAGVRKASRGWAAYSVEEMVFTILIP